MVKSDRKPNQWLKDLLVFVLATFVTGLLTAGASVVFSYLFPDTEPDTDSAHQARVETLLQDISAKLGGLAEKDNTESFMRKRALDDAFLADVNPGGLTVVQAPMMFIGRAWGLGSKRYSTSLKISGLDDAKMLPASVQSVVWEFNNRSIKTMGLQPLFLKNITNNLQLDAKLWFDEKLIRELGIKNPYVITHFLGLPDSE